MSSFDIAAAVFKKLANAVMDAGGSDNDLRRIETDGELQQKIAALIVSIVANLVYDKRKDGWKLLEHAPRRISSVDGLKLIPVLKSGEDRVDGEEMVRRARVELTPPPAGGFGQEDAEWLLEHQNLIPKEWRNYCISFPETVWLDSDGYRLVACLHWDGERWDLYFLWLGCYWYSSVRLLSSSK